MSTVDEGIVLPAKLMSNSRVLEEQTNILNMLNEHFTNISNIIKKAAFVESDFSNLKDFIDSKLSTHTYFVIEPITPFEVKKYIDKLDVHKSTGLDRIGPNILPYCGPNILPYCGDHITTSIAFIINTSIVNGLFPDALKEAYVLPILKGGNKEDSKNYRPISVLPTFPKYLRDT
ncbi:uncharacterized protein LOC123562017 [Mercenaria mercenaria]|uniref:uncharacterized protein LOC123562017 n=1 Tax=Mercenaria mercenaria TaxID=6596 RepID=UPI001E1DD70B|nr:uncharacterized protein LOC123562017 [Mercenaria mercenaria]